ncbi:MAG: FAD-binding oxidoreductase [Chloroflexaceae bacterium]|jgi:glycolate oxidase FAD binding subunit|nr:FAD-binding oxidoreductase [Chloroflexaceae bacterium]
METNQLLRHLNESVGAEHVTDEPTACAPFSVGGVAPALVVAPDSIAELAQVLAAAHAAQALVVPWGGGTKQRMGGRLAQAATPLLVVRTQRLSRIVEYEPADLTISVEAGISMAGLAATLAEHNQMLPVDVALPAHATLGGVLATAADGPRRLGYGTMRDLLIGIQVVEATGRVSKAGGMVVKNVSGFDMMKLYLGSFGSLAIIASANFKLIPRPRAAATVLCSFPTLEAAFGLADAIQQSQLNPVAVEFLSGLNETAADACQLAVLAEGLPAAVERHVRDVSQMAEKVGAVEVQTLRFDDHAAFWQRINDLPQVAELAPGEMVLRLTCLPAEMGSTLANAASLASRGGLKLLTDARALSGVAYLRLAGSGWQPLQDYYNALVARWPNLAVLAAPADAPASLAGWGRDPAGLALMQQIKREFDPQGRLNPGRFVV